MNMIKTQGRCGTDRTIRIVVIAVLLLASIAGVASASTVTYTWKFDKYAIGQDATGSAYESNAPTMPDIIKLPDNSYRMYYGVLLSPAVSGATSAIRSATSTDGISWTVESGYRLFGYGYTGQSGIPVNEGVITGPSVVRLANGTYRMYYQASTQGITTPPDLRVKSATSSDGITWTREGTRIDINYPYGSATEFSLAGHCNVIRFADNDYAIQLSGNYGVNSNTRPSNLVIGTSNDGLTFSNFFDLYTNGHDPYVVKLADGSGYRLFYGNLLERQRTAFSTDGKNWPADSQTTETVLLNSNGDEVTEASTEGPGDRTALELSSGEIMLFVNWKASSSDIALMRQQFSTPIANFTGTPTSGTAPLTVAFTDNSTNTPTSWSWDFGDGSSVNATVKNPIHTYASASTYTVKLTATNSAGSNTLTRTNYITVASDVIPPTISITYPTDNQVFTTDTATVSGTASDNVGLSKVEVKVGSRTWQTATGTTSWSKSVTLASGSNTITARATDKSGNTKDAVTVTYMTGVVAAPLITWQKSLGGTLEDGAYSVQQTSDGGYIVAGYSYSNNDDITGNHGENDCWIVKLDSTGAIIWQKSLGGTSFDSAQSVQQTSDGGYIVAGMTYSNDGDVTGYHGNSDYWIVKLDSTGAITWEKSLGGTSVDNAFSVKQTSDGGYIVAGLSESNDGDVTGNHGNCDYWIVKLDSAGTITWQKSLGGTAYDSAYSVQQTSDGGYIVAGSSDSNNGDVTGNHGIYQHNDYWIVKLNSEGAITWQKSLGGSLDDYARSVQQTSDGGYIVAGESLSNDGDVTGFHGNSDYWIVKLDSAGALTWQKSLGGTNYEYTQSVQQTSDGGYIVAGESLSNDGDVTDNYGSIDYWIVKLDSTGAISWQKSFGGALNDCAESVQQTSDGGYIVAGGSNSIDGDVTGNHGSLDYWIVKLGSSGVVTPVASFTGTPTSGIAPLTVTFTDSSTNTPTSWSWNFGDSSSENSTVKNPVHTYTSASTYTVSLTATNSAGSNTSTRTNYIRGTSTTSESKTGVYRPGDGFYLKSDNGNTWNSNDQYLAWDNAPDDRPIAGDWNNNGHSETGVYRPGDGFYLKMDNTNTWNSNDQYLAWDNAPDDRPIAGDWNNDGYSETGVYRPGDGFYLKMDNSNTWNSNDQYLTWDNAPDDRPIAGDWNNNGYSETGVYRPGVGFYLKMDNSNTWNSNDQYLAWDNAPDDRPIAGNFV